MGGARGNMASVLMSCCLSDQEKVQKSRSRKIDKMLEVDKVRFRRTVKILLLGAGESGKSTFLKQMRIIHGNDFDEEVLRDFKAVVYSNILKGMRVLIDAREKLGIPWEDRGGGIGCEASRIFSLDMSRAVDENAFVQQVDSLKKLWGDSGIRSTFDRRREFQLGDSLPYFLENLNRIGQKSYIPNTLDVLHARKATKGIVEHRMDINNVPFLFLDVGGQRSQRRKWFQCFESVTSILFLASSSEFDQVLQEDRKTNRLQESCSIFETIINNEMFRRVSLILFLNKTDLLTEKIKHVSIKDYFPSFVGDPHQLEDVQNFLIDLFDSRRRERTSALFHHFTTAIDTENIRHVFRDVKDTILQENLRLLMLQ